MRHCERMPSVHTPPGPIVLFSKRIGNSSKNWRVTLLMLRDLSTIMAACWSPQGRSPGSRAAPSFAAHVVGLFERNRWRTGSLHWRRKCEGSAITSAGHHGLTRYRVSQSGADPLQQLAFRLAGSSSLSLLSASILAVFGSNGLCCERLPATLCYWIKHSRGRSL